MTCGALLHLTAEQVSQSRGYGACQLVNAGLYRACNPFYELHRAEHRHCGDRP
jgi:hypothetical protein